MAYWNYCANPEFCEELNSECCSNQHSFLLLPVHIKKKRQNLLVWGELRPFGLIKIMFYKVHFFTCWNISSSHNWNIYDICKGNNNNSYISSVRIPVPACISIQYSEGVRDSTPLQNLQQLFLQYTCINIVKKIFTLLQPSLDYIVAYKLYFHNVSITFIELLLQTSILHHYHQYCWYRPKMSMGENFRYVELPLNINICQ